MREDLISYEVRNINPFEIKECTIGTGAACGGMYLNQAFEELLRCKLESWADDILTANCLEEAFSMFDTRIKVQFNPLLDEANDVYRIPLPGAPNLRDIGLVAGFLSLSRYFKTLSQQRVLMY